MTDSAAGTAAVPTAPTNPAEGERERGPGLERLVFFSDAVIAIALTLLALDLPVPQGDSNRALWHSFVDHLDAEYLTFLISFLVIADFWTLHHRLFDRVQRADHRLVQLNLLYLLWIVVLPFATRVLGEEGDFAFGTAVYALTVAFASVTSGALAWYVHRAGLVTPRAGDTPVRAAWPAFGVALVFLLSVLIALWSTSAAKYFWLVLILLSPLRRITERLRGRRTRPR